MSNSNIYELTSYINPNKYISGRIVEYDIKSANITMLLNAGVIGINEYNYLLSLPKMNREIEVGLMIRSNIEIYKIIQSGILEAKKELVQLNQIDQNNIVRVANDAIYLNQSTDLRYTFVGKNKNVEFKQKGIYSSMLHLKDLIIFFWYDKEINIDVKGINPIAQQLHMEYLLSVIANVMYLIERVSKADALSYLSDFYDDYIKLQLPKEFYRELTPESMYRFKNTKYCCTSIESINDIDINYNLYLIRELWSIVLDLYNMQLKG